MKMQLKAVYARDGYAKPRGLEGWYRDVTCAEMKAGRIGRGVYAIDRLGRVREVRQNGAVKLWKTHNGVEVPYKYSLRECFRVGARDMDDGDALSLSTQVRIVVPVSRQFLPDTPVEIVTDYVLEYDLY